MNSPEFSIPAIRGTQAGHTFYTAMCPIRLLPRLFPVGADEDVSETHQSFRAADPARVRDIANAILTQPDDYHLAAVTVSIEHKTRFVPHNGAKPGDVAAGELFIPLEARIAIIDGIHRVYGLQRALKLRPKLADQCLALLIHVDPAGSRRGRIYSDIKRHERPAAQSLRIGLDDRDEIARLTREVIAAVPVFVDAIELSKTAISNRSRKLFTLSALYHANKILLADLKETPYEQRVKLAAEFWTEVSKHIPGWQQIVKGTESAAEIRAAYIHCHAIGIAAIARAGRTLLSQHPTGWQKRLSKLSSLDWARTNTAVWEGRALIGGRLSKSSSAVARSGIAVQRHLRLRLSSEEEATDTVLVTSE